MDIKQSTTSSKLFKLKEWLNIPETARHLSIVFGEEVTEADVLRLCLDGHLKLSVNFVNHAKAKMGDKFLLPEEWEKNFRNVAAWENAKFLVTEQRLIAVYFSGFDIVFYQKDDELIANGPCAFGPDEKLKSRFLNKLPVKKQDEFLNNMIEGASRFAHTQSEKFNGKVPPSAHSFKGGVETIKGVWDLPMLGAERLDIEHKYQMLTNGPEITLTVLDGAFVKNEDDVVWQLQDRFDKEFIKAQQSEARKRKSLEFYAEFLKKRITNNEIDEKEAENLLEQRKKSLERPRRYDEKFYPAGSLPDDCVIVVRTKALREFEQSNSEKTQMKITSRSIKENSKAAASLLKMVITMAVKGYGYDPHAKRSEKPAEIVSDAEQLGITIDADTVRKWLKEGAELLDQDREI